MKRLPFLILVSRHVVPVCKTSRFICVLNLLCLLICHTFFQFPLHKLNDIFFTKQIHSIMSWRSTSKKKQAPCARQTTNTCYLLLVRFLKPTQFVFSSCSTSDGDADSSHPNAEKSHPEPDGNCPNAESQRAATLMPRTTLN